MTVEYINQIFIIIMYQNNIEPHQVIDYDYSETTQANV